MFLGKMGHVWGKLLNILGSNGAMSGWNLEHTKIQIIVLFEVTGSNFIVK